MANNYNIFEFEMIHAWRYNHILSCLLLFVLLTVLVAVVLQTLPDHVLEVLGEVSHVVVEA